MGKKLVIALGLVVAAGAAHLALNHKNSEASVRLAEAAISETTAQTDKPQANQSSSPSGQNPAQSATTATGSSPGKPAAHAGEPHHPADDRSAQKRFALKPGAQKGRETHRSTAQPTEEGFIQQGGSLQTGTGPQPQPKASDSRTVTARVNDISFGPSRGVLEDYAVYFAQANLTPEEKKRFLSIISEERAAARDIRELSKTTELSPDEQIKLLRENLDQTRLELASTLPESKVSAYRDYRASLPYRNLVETVSMLCTPEGEPIPAETKEAVISTLRKTKGFSPWTSTVRNNKDLSRGDDLACSAVANLLTPKQLEALRTALDQRRNEAAKQKLSAPAKQ